MRTKLLIALILISVILSSSAAFAQPQTSRPGNPQTDAAPAQGTRMSNSEAAAEAPSPDYLMSEIENLTTGLSGRIWQKITVLERPSLTS